MIGSFILAEKLAGATFEVSSATDDGVEREITGASEPGTWTDSDTTNFNGCTQITEGKVTYQADYHIGVIYQNVPIDQGVEIESAYWRPNITTSSNFPELAVYAEDADTASSWSTLPTSVATTTANTRWGVSGLTGFRNVDVTEAIQEVVDRAGWVSGNDIKIVSFDENGDSTGLGCKVSGTAHIVTMNMYDNSAATAAELVVTLADKTTLILKPGGVVNLKTDGVLALKGGQTRTPTPAEFTGDFGTKYERSDEQFIRHDQSTGFADTKLVTYSFWVNRESLSGGTENLFVASVTSGTTARFAMLFTGGNLFRILTRSSGGTTVGDFSGDTIINSTNSWYHIMGSFNLANVNQNHMYVNDVRQNIATTTYSNTNMDFTTVLYALGGNPHIDSQYTDAYYSEFYLNPGTYIDLGIEANRRLFIDASGNPVDLGSDCSTPTGSAPEICLKDGDWENSGTTSDYWPFNQPTKVVGPGA